MSAGSVVSAAGDSSSSWAKLDTARDAMKGEFEKGAQDAGFSIVGWGDVGEWSHAFRLTRFFGRID